MTVDKLVLRPCFAHRWQAPPTCIKQVSNSLIYNDFTVIPEHPRNLSYKLKTKIQLEIFYFFTHFLLLPIIRILFVLHSHSADR